MKEELRVVDGVTYIVKQCPKCKNELLFRQRKETIRLHGACAKCGGEFEFELKGSNK